MGLEDEIAIVGAGCRFPGADNLDEFWEVLINGENHVKEIPATRWNNSAFYDEDQTAPGKIYVNKAGLLKNHDKWDSRLFGISDVEACRVDPQQRYVLECVHMALEDGGITRKQINGTNTGVIIGSMNNDYKVMANSDLTELGGYTATGTASSVLAARVSYVYNLHGTCLTLDTACSSALIAIHLASQAIQTGDCEMMICGGVSSILSPDTFKALCEARMLSAVGQCQSFCDTADGYARGEGCGVVILKRLKAAIEDGNKVWATIKTGSNQDGGTARPMTAPSTDQQVKLLKHVYETHHFNASDIQYIEAHGTGTPRGDPTEINALGTFFSSERSKQSAPLLFGSVKSNIGHTESAAGVAGLLKVLLMMKHGKYVPSLHVKPDKSNVNKGIKLSEYNLDISTSVQDFPLNKDGERHVCLNSFGFGGSNTHAIVTGKLNKPLSKENARVKQLVPICISGVDSEALKLNLERFVNDITESIDSQHDISYTSLHHRDMFAFRTLVFGHDVKEIQVECNHRLGRIHDIVSRKKHNKVFVFCGVGTTWTGMGQDLMRENEVFRKAVDEIDVYLEPLTKWRMRDKFLADTNYEDPFLNHVAIFCVQVALTEVWKSFGIIPDVIVGQSVGEVAAAYAANLLSLEDAVKVIYFRSEILARQSGGSMTVVGNMNIKDVENMCGKYEDKVCIAVYSSPVACTLSGSTEELKELTDGLSEIGKDSKVFIRELKVKCAYHSPLLQGCIAEITSMIESSFESNQSRQANQYRKTIPMISTVTGETADSAQMRTGKYWATNIRQPVRFMQSIQKAFDENSFNVYLEIGPRPVLRAHLENIVGGPNTARAVPSMLPKQELQCLHRSLSELFELGIDIVDSSFNKPGQYLPTALPRYSFNRTTELFLPKVTREYLAGYTVDNNHMFVRTARGPLDVRFEIRVGEKSTPFVYDHFLSEKVIVPGATYVESGFHIGSELLKNPVDRLSVSFSFSKTFSPPSGRDTYLDVQVHGQTDSDVRFSVMNSGSTLANGTVSKRCTPMRHAVNVDFLRVHCPIYKIKSECYASLGKLNFRYGASLSLIQGAWVSDSGTKCLTELYVPENLCGQLTKTHLHPAIIDSVFQIFGILIKNTSHGFVVPKGIDSVVANAPIESLMYAYGEEIKTTDTSTHYNAVLLSQKGSVIAEFENFYTKIISSDKILHDKAYTYQLDWTEAENVSYTMDENQTKRILLYSDGKPSEWLSDLRKHTDVTPIAIDEKVTIPHQESYDNMILLYHVGGLLNKYSEDDTQEVFDRATDRFFNVKNILSALKAIDNRLSLVVVTENTQPCPDRDTFCYNGADMWGLIRSAALEGSIKNMKIIDIDKGNVDITSLITLLFGSGNEIEFALSGKTLYLPKLSTKLRKGKSKRQVSVSKTDKMVITSRRSDDINELFLSMSVDSKQLANTVPIVIDSLTRHAENVYMQTIRDNDMADALLQKQEDEGYQLIAVEGRGINKETNQRVLFLYPVGAKTVVDIPREHVVNESDCFTNSNGILILTNIIYHLAASIKEGIHVSVLVNHKQPDIGQDMFIDMLKKRRCTTQILTTEELQTVSGTIPVMVIAEVLSSERWAEVVRTLPRIKRLITLNIFVPKHLLIWMNLNYPCLELTILSAVELFNANSIRSAMSTIKYYLQKFEVTSIINEKSRFVLDLPMPDIQIRAKLNDRSLKCFCTTKSLFRSQACYIIVGGLTGLGWELLQSMAENGAGVLVTLSRRVPSNIIQEEIGNLQKKYNCRIVSLQSDLSNLKSVKEAFSEIHERFPNYPIKGIFHGAGVLADGVLDNLDFQKVQTVLKPKIHGTWNLHLASLNCPLDYFVLHSSIVSVIGNPGQCNYAAANSFIDSFALYRRSRGLPAQSINWGALAVGMAVDSNEIKSQLKRSGFGALSIKQIKEFFLEGLVRDETSVVYADVEWDQLLSRTNLPRSSSKYSELVVNNPSNSLGNAAIHFDIDESLKLGKSELTEKIKSVLKKIIQEQLVVEEDALKDEKSITDIGIDSMAAMSLSNRIDDVFKCRITLVILLSEGTSLSTIAEYIRQNVGSGSNEKELHDGDDTLEFGKLFESNEFTFMQLDFFKPYNKNRDDPFYLRVIDVEICDVQVDLSEWYTILKHVLKMHPELRKKLYFSETGEVSVESCPEDNPELDIVKCPVFPREDTLRSDVRFTVPADINGRVQISFRISEPASNTILRIITHAVVMDMRGMSLLCRDIEATANAYVSRVELPERPLIDIPAVVRTHIKPRMHALANYWKRYLDCDIRPVTLGTDSGLQTVDAKDCSITDLKVPCDTVSEIKKYIARLGISLYEFIMSLYQLYLYIGSNTSVVTVGTAADMRLHVPELKSVITRCVNYLPIVAQVDDTQTIDTFIKENSTSLSTTTLHGAYPNSLILNELKSNEARENVFRHFLAMNDMGEINKVMKDDNSKASILQIWHIRHNRETFVFVRHDLRTNQIKLEIGQNTKICGQYGQDFSAKIMRLAEAALFCSNKTISNLRDELSASGGIKKPSIAKDKINSGGPPRLPAHDYSTSHSNDASVERRSTHKEKEHVGNVSTNPCLAITDTNASPKKVERIAPRAILHQSLPVKENKTIMVAKDSPKSHMELDLLKPNNVKNVINAIGSDNMKIGISKEKNIFDIKELSSSSIKSKSPENKDNMYGQQQKIQNHSNKIILATGEFEKQTSHGWDHKVQVRLCVIDGKAVLEWGKEKRMRKNKPRLVQLAELGEVIMQDINGLPSLIISAGKNLLVLKTPSRHQAGQWLEVIRGSAKKVVSNI